MTATTKTVKAINYTTEQAEQMVLDYQSGITVEAIAETLGKSVRSVVAKLSREKVYVAKVYKTKAGEPVEKKDSLADELGMLVGLTEPEIESLTKANKTALQKVLAIVKTAMLDKNQVI